MKVTRFFVALSVLSASSLCSGQDIDTPVRASFVGEHFSATIQHYHEYSRHGGLSAYNGAPITKLSFHRDLGQGTLHYATTSAANEVHRYAGLSAGRLTLAYFEGKGDSFSKPGTDLFKDLNQFFFHGGARQAFTFQGGGVHFDLSERAGVRFAGTRVSAAGVQDRLGFYAGLTAGRFTAGLFSVERSGQRVGQGFNLALAGKRMDLEYQQLGSETGAYVRRLGFSVLSNPMARWSVDVEDASNPLYRDGEERRVMLRYQRSFGRGALFRATEGDAGGEEQEKKSGAGKFIGIAAVGVGVGVAAASISSGDSTQDNTQRFGARNDAAFDVLNGINPVSVRLNREHGGWIFRAADGSFGYTNPILGEVASVNIGNPLTSVPSGTTAAASYHTHGGPDPRYDNENFSPQDVASDNLIGLDGYLGTPGGFMKLHDVSDGSIVTLGKIAN